MLDKSRTMLDEVGPTRFWGNKPLARTLGNKPLKIFCRKLTPSVWLLIHGMLPTCRRKAVDYSEYC